MPRRLLPVLFAALVVGPAATAPKLKEQPSASSYWPTVRGTTLEYQPLSGTVTHTERVTAVEQAGGVTTVTTELVGADTKATPWNKIEIRKDGVFMTEEVGQAYDPPVCLLKFPVKPGEKWESVTKRPGLGLIRFARQVGEEKVIETPAGKFKAVRVESEVGVAGMPPWAAHVLWFAPEVGIVQIDGVRTLKTRTPGK